MAERKTLLKRYGIPLNQLDFQYIKQCEDARQMEKIVHILQSGEEGYFPDLTKCAEDKLRILKPNSRLFRCEEQIRRRDDSDASEVQPIYEFSRSVRDREQRLAACIPSKDDDIMVPLRKVGIIRTDIIGQSNDNQNTVETKDVSTARTNNEKRICTTDYRKWDRYDPEEEILRMDLAEERVQEEVERKNRLNSHKSASTPLITELKEEEERIRKLTDVERDTLGEEHRLRGNEYYRTKEFDAAIAEYTRAISINPEKDAAAYNNRALTYLKQKKYQDALRDCEKCLTIEPDNVKAIYRLAESNMQCGFKEKALELFNKVLEISPDNSNNAKAFIDYLRLQINESPPANATRLRIEEEPKITKKESKIKKEEKIEQIEKISTETKYELASVINPKDISTNIEKVPTEKKSQNAKDKEKGKAKEKEKEKEKEYDLASLIRPKEIITNKWADAAANMLGNQNCSDMQQNEMRKTDFKTQNQFKETDNNNKEMEIRLPIFNDSGTTKGNKTLIEEL